MKIGFLGLGAMGSRMAARLVQAGHEVTVWNRSRRDFDALLEAGALHASTPADAALGADIVFSMVRDDAASDDVWFGSNGACKSLDGEAIAVECSTLSAPHVERLSGRFARHNRRFVDAPLAGSRPQAEAGQLIFFAGGSKVDIEVVEPVLLQMGGAVHHAGDVGAGAVVKLMVNALFGAQLAMFGELIGFAAKAGIDPNTAVSILGETPVVSPAAKLASGAMLAGAYAPAFPIDLVAKDFDLLNTSGKKASASLPLSEATGKVYRKATKEGFADDNITGIVQRYWSR